MNLRVVDIGQFYTPLALKLHSFGLARLHDPNWTGMELFQRLKRPVRGREEPVDLLRKPLKDGFLFCLGRWLYEDYCKDVTYASGLGGEYLVWYMEDYLGFLMTHGASTSDDVVSETQRMVDAVDQLYEDDEEAYFRLLDAHRNRRSFLKQFERLSASYENIVNTAEDSYARNYADRVLHDRELCGYIAELIVTIGFDGTIEDEEPCQWVDRTQIPEWARKTLYARERGKCALCGADLILELEGNVHIDHIIPLSRGGCNDLVNLQMLCETCNLSKTNKKVPVRSSIPPYMQRRTR